MSIHGNPTARCGLRTRRRWCRHRDPRPRAASVSARCARSTMAMSLRRAAIGEFLAARAPEGRAPAARASILKQRASRTAGTHCSELPPRFEGKKEALRQLVGRGRPTACLRTHGDTSQEATSAWWFTERGTLAHCSRTSPVLAWPSLVWPLRCLCPACAPRGGIALAEQGAGRARAARGAMAESFFFFFFCRSASSSNALGKKERE